ncbi:MAG: hypothetical protein H6R15_958 [Proteobacteria bacterium]|nr:hypothetical protein [Pseudomonadota bacterium]
MTGYASTLPLGQQASLGSLLAEVANGVTQAQRQLDEDAQARVSSYVKTPQGGIALPPLWYTFGEIKVDFEMAASVTRIAKEQAGAAGVRLDCRLVNPLAVSLFGYSAASSFKVSLTLAPQDAAILRPALPTEP